MWLTLAFTSAALLGFYDAAKKKSLTGNAVLPVLLLNTLFSALFLLPMIVSAECDLGWFDGTILAASPGTLQAHGLVLLKSAIVLTSWIFGYFAMKHLPITIVGPINATRPVMVLIGAMLIFGERLNACQWTGVVLTLLSLFLLSRSSRREGVDFRHNIWILCIAVAALAAVVSAGAYTHLRAPATAAELGCRRGREK
ncbi:MAG: DMT family transporter, partial [Alistipes sp.]|nr:DMT family transporter [Alistipes sp.]